MIIDKQRNLKSVHQIQKQIEINQQTCCWLHKKKLYVLQLKCDRTDTLYSCEIQKLSLAHQEFKFQEQIFEHYYKLVSDKLLAGFIMGYGKISLNQEPHEEKQLEKNPVKEISLYKLDLISIHNQKRQKSIFLGKQICVYIIKPQQQGFGFTTQAYKLFRTYWRNVLVRRQKFVKKISLHNLSKEAKRYQGRNCAICDNGKLILSLSNGLNSRLRKVNIGYIRFGIIKYPIFFNSQVLIFNEMIIRKRKHLRRIDYHKILFFIDTNLIAYVPNDKCKLILCDLRQPYHEQSVNLEIEGGLEIDSDNLNSDDQQELEQTQIEIQQQDQEDQKKIKRIKKIKKNKKIKNIKKIKMIKKINKISKQKYKNKKINNNYNLSNQHGVNWSQRNWKQQKKKKKKKKKRKKKKKNKKKKMKQSKNQNKLWD